MNTHALAPLSAIEDGCSAAFAPETPDGPRPLMVIRQGEQVYAYANRCPHLGLPLDFTPGRFLTLDGEYILCTSHGALFRIEDGLCVSGPCRGQALDVVPCVVDRHGMIMVADDET